MIVVICKVARMNYYNIFKNCFWKLAYNAMLEVKRHFKRNCNKLCGCVAIVALAFRIVKEKFAFTILFISEAF